MSTPPYYKKKVDTNQAEIVEALRKAGCSVFIASSVGRGFPDLVIGKGGRTLLVEVKDKKGVLTEDQIKFHTEWKGSAIVIVRTVEEALAIARSL
jgi:Holliday junction resolvase